METPLLHKQKQVGLSAVRRSCKLISFSILTSMVVILLVTSKQESPTELIRWVVPKVVQGKSVSMNPKMSYRYVQSGALHNDNGNTQQVLELTGSGPSKLSAVNVYFMCCRRGPLCEQSLTKCRNGIQYRSWTKSRRIKLLLPTKLFEAAQYPAWLCRCKLADLSGFSTL
jgi:hypothetical protein